MDQESRSDRYQRLHEHGQNQHDGAPAGSQREAGAETHDERAHAEGVGKLLGRCGRGTEGPVLGVDDPDDGREEPSPDETRAHVDPVMEISQ